MAKHIMCQNPKKFQLAHPNLGGANCLCNARAKHIEINSAKTTGATGGPNDLIFFAPFLKSKFKNALFSQTIDLGQQLQRFLLA